MLRTESWSLCRISLEFNQKCEAAVKNQIIPAFTQLQTQQLLCTLSSSSCYEVMWINHCSDQCIVVLCTARTQYISSVFCHSTKCYIAITVQLVRQCKTQQLYLPLLHTTFFKHWLSSTSLYYYDWMFWCPNVCILKSVQCVIFCDYPPCSD